MNQPPGAPDGWRGPGGHQQNQGDAGNQPQIGRSFGGFPQSMQQQGPPQQGPAPVLLPPSYHPSTPSGGHSLPTLADLTGGASSGHHPPPPYNTHPPPPAPSHSLPALGQTVPHQSPQSFMSRDRDRDMQEMRDRERRERELQRQIEQEHRDREARERHERERDRDHIERMHREQQQQQQQHPVQSHTGSIPIHQPVASKVPNSIHGPNGLLSNIGSGQASQASNAQAGNRGGSNIFGIPALPAGNPSRQSSFMHQPVGPPQPQPGPGFIGPGPGPGPGPVPGPVPGPGPSPMPGQATLGQGQQPILNDALSYLDQVKVQFSDHPDVYNRFLDIMKDFKSQTIDTPGVIERVSDLFSGHPGLIQGFNTFLPPGYRIECGTDDNPNAIRVTTPSGTSTMTQSSQQRSRGLFDYLPSSGAYLRQDPSEDRPGWPQPQRQFSPAARSTGMAAYGQQTQPQARENSFDQDASNATLVHQQEQRGVSHLQNAVSAATTGNSARPTSMMQISPGLSQPLAVAQSGVLPGLPGQPGDMKRGPVEFNHAISYVNKIKNRFAQQPDIYKQFLEILQTYQRESKPIQDVYAQVTDLFSTAPDLLEDFKQFLPESAAQAKAQAAARAAAEEMTVSNVRGDSGYTGSQIAQAQTPRPAAKMPPMGQFDPPSTSKENKKRRGGPGQQSSAQTGGPSTSIENIGGAQASKIGAVQVGNANKRAKLNHTRPAQPEVPLVSPTLVPQLPEPLPPLSSLSSTQEELGFFDRAKKHIGNKATYTEFLKLTNLFSQDLIDKHVLLDRAAAFIGNNPDLMNWFTRFLGVEIQEEVIEARIRPDPGRVNLAHCRSLGPSYRHLPKRDQTKLCKGRDPMCHQVLNDEWASHPTWASEDSGFVAHRKNQYEEGLHRLEEERHDYDFHIESCHRTIQLMEPICQQINLMNDSERANFVLARGLGGQSEAIPKRIIMKLYDRDGGAKVWQAMFERPCAVLPIVLNRLKQKLEEWKQSQREWEKVWRDQTSKFFWKSLDHQGINAKNLDKKNFQQKTLTSEIQAKYEEGKKTREAGFREPKHQFEFYFKDREVIHDAAHLILVALEADRSTYNSGEQEKIATFLKDFIPVFFDLDRNSFIDFMSDIYGNGPSNGDLDDGAGSDGASTSKIRISNLRKADLLRRGVLERRNGKEGSTFSGSKESTPAAAAMSDHEADDETLANLQQGSGAGAGAERKWIAHALKGVEQPSRPYELDETYQRTVYNLYCNGNVYCFFRLFETLYSRLLAIKNNEAAVHEAVIKAFGDGDQPKAAVTLRMIDKLPKDFFQRVGPTANYYRQIIQMCELVISGLMDLSHLEETLRRFYMQTGWQLYTIDKLLAAIIRFIMNIIGSDSKDKSLDIINLFNKDREKTATSRAQELQYRKQVEKYVKDGEMYRVSYDATNSKTTIRLFPSDESTFESDTLSDDAKWQYYIASYEMLDNTEGVDLSQVRVPYLRRRLPQSKGSVEDTYARVFGTLENEDTQTVSISPDNYKIYWEGGFNFHREISGREKKQRQQQQQQQENEQFEERLVKNPAWAREETEEAVYLRMTAWMKALEADLSGYEAALTRRPTGLGLTGDVTMSEGAT